MRPPRILITTTASQTLTFLRGFPSYLSARGWQVHVVSAPGVELAACGNAPGVETHELAMDRVPSPRDPGALAAWVRLLHKVRPDIIFAASPKASLLSMVAGKIVGVPARIYAIVGLRLETTTGAFRQLLWAMEKLTIAASSAQTVVSPSLGRRLDALGLTDGSWQLIGNGSFFGLHVRQFQRPAKRALTATGPVIGFVGRITRDKGIGELASAFLQVRKRYPNAKLLIVGETEGAEHYLTDLPADALTLAGRVADPSDLYAQMDVFTLPTYREGFGSVVIEAQAAGVPVVATDATGARDAIGEGEYGLMVPVGDADALAAAIIRVLDDADLRTRLQEAGARWASRFERAYLWRLTDQYLRAQLRATRAARLPQSPRHKQ